MYFITQGADIGWGSRPALSTLLLALVSFVMFVVIEMRTERPTFDFSVFRIRAFSGAMFGSMGMNFSYWPLMIYLPIYFHGVLVMGFLLLEGVRSALARALPEGWDAATSQRLAEQVAAGEFAGLTTSTDLAMAHAALVRGFEWVMLYGMAGAWLLALLSRIAFGVSTKMSAQRVEP